MNASDADAKNDVVHKNAKKGANSNSTMVSLQREREREKRAERDGKPQRASRPTWL